MSTNKTSATNDILGHQYRWMRAGWPLAAANIGLFATLILLWSANPSLEQVRKWGPVPLWWAAGVAASLIFAIVFLVLRRRSVVQSARQLDARLEARNRLETAATLETANDPIARAQREETAEFLRHAPVKPRQRHLRILVVLFVIAVVTHLFTLTMWTRPWRKVEEPIAKARTPHNPPKATITWKTPKPETTAAPIEEVPLTAVADSTSGLKDMALVISVNGEQRMSVKVPVDALDKSGQHPVAVSMYLDQLNVEPFDMVSYYLTAQRIAPGKLPETTSPVQFVQVKPFRDDVLNGPNMPSGGGGTPTQQKALASITALKIAQLRLIKENFFLAHADLAHDNASWVTENKRVGGEQTVLETKTGQTVQALTEEGMPAEILDLLAQAQPLMTDAAGKIAAKENTPALPPQGKSLAFLTDTEKFIKKMIAKGGSPAAAAPKPKDPFEKQKELEMKQRGATPAGELELLAKEQERLAQDMAKESQQDQAGQPDQGQGQSQPGQPQQGQPQPGQQPGQQGQAPQGQQGQASQGQQGQGGQTPGTQANTPDPNQINGTPSERQTQISQRLGALLNGQNFDPSVTEHLENGRKEAGDALKQLDAGDNAKAQEPTATAARELGLAKQEMNKTGEEKAQEQIAAAVKLLNDAAGQARNAPQQATDDAARESAQKSAENTQKAANDLGRAAQNQQETGSEKEAQRMKDFANMLNDAKLRSDLKGLGNQPRDTKQAGAVGDELAKIADQLATQPGVKMTPDQLAQLIERLERSKANLDRLAEMERAANGQQPGQQPGQGPGQGTGPKPDPNAQQQGKEQGQGQGEGAGKDPSQQNAQGQGTTPSQQPGGQGQTQGKSPNAQGAGAGAGKGMRKQFERQVLDDIGTEMAEAQELLPPSALNELRSSLVGPSKSIGSGNVTASFGKIDGPLSSMISMLRAELEHVQRQHELADQTAAKAPAAYREAVADYFEQLSRDYQKQEAPAATPAPGGTAAP